MPKTDNSRPSRKGLTPPRPRTTPRSSLQNHNPELEGKQLVQPKPPAKANPREPLTTLSIPSPLGKTNEVPIHRVHTLVIGSGAAGLNAAVQLHANGVEDIVIVTEGLRMGTSINTGSDKQTYYKLGMYGADPDCPESLARSFFDGGGMHGDLALVEAALSARAFLNLVNLGVRFPTDSSGQFVGYKTDHDPLQRATSVGPYTSREMCRVLIQEVRRRKIRIMENRVVASLLTFQQDGKPRAAGAIAIDTAANAFEVFAADNTIFAVGGPGGLYKTSVYPCIHTGAIGLALMAGAKARSLPESQYGLASTKFRWNVSGAYMQALPRFISTGPADKSDEQEFLRPWFDSVGRMNTAVFLKGYQWPFDPRKIVGGSSIIDVLVYIETVIKKRRVFLDFRSNSDGLDFSTLGEEALTYLRNSETLFGTPLERLKKMNPAAIQVYRDHEIDIEKEPLEIAVCAQHNNGGLAGNRWWESENIKHLFPVGEVNGSHGVYRPGGSALNSGQVAGFRAAEYIANCYSESSLDLAACLAEADAKLDELLSWLDICSKASVDWQTIRESLQSRMTRAGAHVRSIDSLTTAVADAWREWEALKRDGCSGNMTEAIRNRQLCFAHAVYLEATLAAVKSGTGSRGSAVILDAKGISAHRKLSKEWNFAPENPAFRERILETVAYPDGKTENNWVERRPIPESDAWFEKAWALFREGKIYR